MENSVVFSVDSGECSEDEEDDIQRKEELRQLLSEQLHDDLLDDSMATSVDGEISVVSSLRYSLSPSDRMDVVTPDMRTATSPSTNHISANQSHDSHMTSPITTSRHNSTSPLPPPHTQPQPLHHTETSPSPLPTEYHHHHHYDQNHLYSHSLEQPPATLSHQALSHAPPTLHDSDVPPPSSAYDETSLNPVEFVQHNSDLGHLHAPHLHVNVNTEHQEREQDVEEVANLNKVHGRNVVAGPSSLVDVCSGEQSDIFAGTSQAYGDYNYHMEKNFTQHISPSEEQPVSLEVNHHHHHHHREEYWVDNDDGRLDVLSPSLQQMGLRQLGVLFKARGRHIAELTQQISAQAEDNERHVRILRQEKSLLEKERDQLNVHVGELEAIQLSLEKQVATYQGQLTAEQTRSKALDTNKKELLTRLQADEALIKSLTDQVNELTSSDTLSRVRDSYSSAMAQSNHQHQQEMLQLQQQIGELQEEMDKKEETISQLEQELHQLQSHYEAELVSKDQLLAHREQELQKQIKLVTQENFPRKQAANLVGSDDEVSGVAQQLDFGTGGVVGGCGVGRASEGEERLKELAAQVEDLTYQLSTTQEELQAAMERAENSEAMLSEQALQLSEMEEEREQLSHQLEEIRAELETFKSTVATEKKEALEQCRAACLKLHEDSTRRLRESVEAEKEKTSQQHERHLAQLKSDLATVQEQYVALCSEKEKLSSRIEELEAEKLSSVQAALDKGRLEWLQQQEALVKEAVGVAREEWQEGMEQENKKRVELALKEQELVWDKKLELEKSQALGSAKAQFSKELAEATSKLEEEHSHQLDEFKKEREAVSEREISREEWEREKERAVAEAVEQARTKWLEEKENSLQQRVESALSTAERLWKEQYNGELSKLQRQLEEAKTSSAPRGGSGEGVGVAVREARETWEREQRGKVEEAVRLAKEKFASELAMRVELAVTNERGKWEEENQRLWQQRQDSLLATAHQEWSKAQESVLQAELERTKKDWEREIEKRKQVSLEEAVAHTKQHYEGLLKLVRSELVSKHEREKVVMAGEIRQLEARVATLLKEQQCLSSESGLLPSGRSNGFDAKAGENGRPFNRASLSDSDVQQLRPLIQAAMSNVKRDMLALLQEIQEASKSRHERELVQVRETTARQMKHYYLQCLHQLVNGNNSSSICGGGGHVASAITTNGLCRDFFENHLTSGLPVPGVGARYSQQEPLQAVQHPPHYYDENLKTDNSCDTRQVKGGASTFPTANTVPGLPPANSVLRNRDSNSQRQKVSEIRVKKAGAHNSEKRRSSGTSGSGGSSAVSHRPQATTVPSALPPHSRTSLGNSSHVADVGRCKNLDSGRRSGVKGGAVHASQGGKVAGTGSAVKKDLFGRSSSGGGGGGKRTASSAHLVHGVSDNRRMTERKSNNNRRN